MDGTTMQMNASHPQTFVGTVQEDTRPTSAPSPNTHSVSCNVVGHVSWSRECLTFLKKVDECNCQNPKNALQFIPSTKSWTWIAYYEEWQDWLGPNMCEHRHNLRDNPSYTAWPAHVQRNNRDKPNYMHDWDWDMQDPQAQIQDT